MTVEQANTMLVLLMEIRDHLWWLSLVATGIATFLVMWAATMPLWRR